MKIGDTVVYVQSKTEAGESGGFNGHRDHPAIVTCVHSDTCVNLKVFFDCGAVEDRTSIEARHVVGNEEYCHFRPVGF